MVELTTFDYYDTEPIEEELYDELPDLHPYNINFEAGDIETTLFITNIGLVIWIAAVYISVSILLLACFKI